MLRWAYNRYKITNCYIHVPTFALLIRQYTIICNLCIVFQVSLFCNVHFASGRLVFSSCLCYEMQSYEIFFTYAIRACEFLRRINFLCNFFTRNSLLCIFFTQNQITLTNCKFRDEISEMHVGGSSGSHRGFVVSHHYLYILCIYPVILIPTA